MTDERGFTRKDYVFFGLTDKSLHTFEAIQVLCANSLLDDAYVLVRILIEGIINGTYVSTMNDSVANDYADFSDYREWIEFQDLAKVAPEITSTVPTTDVEEMKRKHAALRARYEKNANGDWSPENLFKRAAAIDMAVGHGLNLMRTLVNSPWRKACAWVHGTSASILSRVEESKSGVVIHRRYRAEEAAGVLFMSNMAIFALLALADLRLGTKNKNDWRSLYDFWGGKPSAPTT